MKKIKCISLLFTLLGLLNFSNNVIAVTHIIQVANFSFTPSNINNVQLGDIIRWEWVGGIHTTTSSSIPAGAATWDQIISSGISFYEYTPTVTGVYSYVCTPHIGLGMIGSFTVLNPGPSTRTSSQSGNWSQSSTWGGNPPPTSVDAAIINGGFTVTVDNSNAVCSSVQVGGSALGQGTGTLSFSSGSHLTVSGITNIGPVNNNNTSGSLNMSSGGTLTCQGITLNRLGTWTAGTGTVEFTATNTIPIDNNVIFNNLTMSGGTTTIAHNLTVSGNLLINSGASLNGGANTLSLAGNWTNNGTFTGNTGTVTFNKNGNQAITGNGINNFNSLRLDEGTSVNNTLEVLSTHFNGASNFLTLVNGTFKISGNFSFSNTFILGPTYNIQPATGLWINNPNVTVIAQAGGISVRGLLRLTAGTINIGTSIDQSLIYVTGSTINIEGGALHIAGLLTRNNATATTTYIQSGGTVTLVEQGSTDPIFAGFDLGAVGSTFSMSGGTIVLRNASSAPSDFLNASAVATVTGGTLQIGDAGTLNSQTIRIQSPRPIGNLLVSNTTSQSVKPIATLVNSSLSILGNVTIQPGTSFNSNGFNITLGGDWVDNGSFTNGGNTVLFNGSGPQGLTNPSGETFNILDIAKTGETLTLNGNTTVNNSFSLTSGTIAVGNSILTLNSTVTGGGTLTSSPSGTVSYNQGSAGQSVLSGNYGNLVFSDFSKTLASSGTIGVAGTFTPGGGGSHTVTGSTINFNGGSQAIPVFGYNNLTASGSGTKNATGTIIIGGNLTINSSVVLSGATTLSLDGTSHFNAGTLSAGTITVGTGGTLTNNGTTTATSILNGAGSIIQGSSGQLNIPGTASIATLNTSAAGNTVSYNGNIPQTLNGSLFHNLTIANPTGLNMLNDVTINGTLSIISGTLTTNSNNVILGSAATLSESPGQGIVGFVRTTRNLSATTGTESFGNIGADLVLNGVAPGSTIVLRKTGTALNGNGHSSINRYFDITPSTNTGLNAGLVFHYNNNEINGQTAALLDLYKSQDNGSTWTNLGGTVNTLAGTITLSGLNDFSRWTASDTNNRIGNTLSPSTTSISPASKFLASPTFTLTINGSNFINARSTVRFNGSNRTTTFINSTQLTASIPASDLQTIGAFPVTVLNPGGGGLSNAQTFTVNPLPARKINVETAANGSGTIVSGQSLASGSSMTVYAISRDSLNNFIANIAASSWTLENSTGGVVAGDLLSAADNKSATFTGHVIGTTDIKASSGVLTPTPSGVITVTAGSATIQGIIAYKNSVSTPMANITVVLKLNGVVINQATTDATGHYAFTGLADGTYSLVCSITRPWGGVNSTDALLIMKHYVSSNPLSGLNLKVADVNGSANVNSLDALIVSRRFTGLITSFSVGDWQTETNSLIVSGLGVTTANLFVLCTGDVNGSYVPAP
ncbi:MAG: dockerin type I domain-containing protein [Bacteroidota bacterium]